MVCGLSTSRVLSMAFPWHATPAGPRMLSMEEPERTSSEPRDRIGPLMTVICRYIPLFCINFIQFPHCNMMHRYAKSVPLLLQCLTKVSQGENTPNFRHELRVVAINILFDEGWALSQTLLKFLKHQSESFGARWLAYDAFVCMCWNDVLWGRPALNPISIEEVQSVPDSDGGAWFIPLLKVVRWSCFVVGQPQTISNQSDIELLEHNRRMNQSRWHPCSSSYRLESCF